MPNACRFLPCLLAVLSCWHGEYLCRPLLPLLGALTDLLAPRWSAHWSLDPSDMTLALAAAPRSADILPTFGLPDGALEARFPLRHLLLPVAVALAANGLRDTRRWALVVVALLCSLTVLALVQGLGLIELSLVRQAASMGFAYEGSPWLPLMVGVEAGGRWLPCILIAASAQARNWRRCQRHHASPTAPTSTAGAAHS